MKNIKTLNAEIAAYNKKHSTVKKSVKDIVFDELRAQGYNVKSWKDIATYERGADNEPINYMTGRPYSGVNQLLLPSGAYLTWNQIQKIGGHVKKGANSYLVVFCKSVVKNTEDDENTEDKQEARMILRYYRVFNAEDVENIPPCDFLSDENYTAEELTELYNFI